MKEADFYRKCGFEDVGYQSPPLSCDDTYPPYIHDEVLLSVKSIQEHQTADTVTFAFMTDLHYAMNNNHTVRMKRTVNAYKEVAKRAHIDKLVMGGDYVNEGCKEYKSDCFRELRALLDGLDYYPINGNHDDGSIWDISYIKAEKSTNHLTHDDLYKLFYNHLPSIGGEFDEKNHGLYYMYNDHISKTRYIFLDTEDVPYTMDENGKLIYGGQWLFTLSQSQVDWLVNCALSFEESGWSVMLFGHSILLPSELNDGGKFRENLGILHKIINAFKNREKANFDFGSGDFLRTVNVDFSRTEKADVIGFFVGDYHCDEIEYENGIPYVLTANAVMYFTEEPKYNKRYDGDKSEVLFDVITIDKKKRKIFITRVGAGSDRETGY